MKPQWLRTLVLTLTMSPVMFGCGEPMNPPLVAPPADHVEHNLTASGFEIEFNPEVDILFVFDNSTSMQEEIDEVSANAGKFIEGIRRNDKIDFHIAATTVWDSDNRPADKMSEKRQYKFSPSYAQGELRPLTHPDRRDLVFVDSERFVTKSSTYEGYRPSETPAYVDLLRSLLNINVIPHTEGGPQWEESLSPVKNLLEDNSLKSGPNRGFLRNEAHLVVIFMTDAPDSSPGITAESFYQDLVAAKGDNFSVYAALALSANNSSDCKIDPSWTKPSKMISLIEDYVHPDSSESHLFSICSRNYGDVLGRIGSNISEQIFPKEICLPNVPEVSSYDWKDIQVFYGDNPDPLVPGQDWTYSIKNSSNHCLKLNQQIEERYHQGGKIQVKYTPLHPSTVRNGRAIKNNGPAGNQ